MKCGFSNVAVVGAGAEDDVAELDSAVGICGGADDGPGEVAAVSAFM